LTKKDIAFNFYWRLS